MPIADRSDWTTGGAIIQFQRCRHCSSAAYLPLAACGTCGGTDFIVEQIGGGGTVRAKTVIYRAPGPELQHLTPYTIAIVEAVEGIRLMGHAAPDLNIGDRVKITVARFAGGLAPFFIARP